MAFILKKRSHKLLCVLALLIVVLGLLELTNTTHLLHSEKLKPVGTTASAFTKGSSTSASKPSGKSSSKIPPSTATTKQPADENGTTPGALIAPWGSFANTYKASINDQMGSTCNTSPGATCQIIFTNGSQTKSVEAQTTDAGGAAYWSWTPKSVGLTPGTWHITAKAVMGSQVKTTSNDPLTLEIT